MAKSTYIASDGTDSQVVVDRPCVLVGVYGFNLGAAAATIKVHNTAATPTAGTTEVVHAITLPAGGGNNQVLPGLELSAGLAITITTQATAGGSTAVGANEVFASLHWEPR